jgi:hypothetical protein
MDGMIFNVLTKTTNVELIIHTYNSDTTSLKDDDGLVDDGLVDGVDLFLASILGKHRSLEMILRNDNMRFGFDGFGKSPITSSSMTEDCRFPVRRTSMASSSGASSLPKVVLAFFVCSSRFVLASSVNFNASRAILIHILAISTNVFLELDTICDSKGQLSVKTTSKYIERDVQ